MTGELMSKSTATRKPFWAATSSMALRFFSVRLPLPHQFRTKASMPAPRGLIDLAGHRLMVVRVVGGWRQVGELARVPGVLVEPGIVEGQYQPIRLGLGMWRVG